MEQLKQMHPVLTVFLIIILIAFIIDHKRLMKENHEWYRLYIISKINVDTFEGLAIVKAIQAGDSSETILKQLKQVNQDNSAALARMYGKWYNELIKFL